MRRIVLDSISLVLALGHLSTQATAATISNTFDSDAEGWTGNTGQVALAWTAAGGNPGGHIRTTDTGAGTINGYAFGAFAGPDFLGDLSAFDGGTLSLDIATSFRDGGTFSSFGNLITIGGGLTARVDIAANAPVGEWVSYSTR